MNQDSGQALLGRNAELEAEIARLRRALEAAKQNTTRLEAKLGRAEARGRAELTSMRAMVAAAQASGSATRKLVHEAKAEAGRAALEGRAKLAAADAMERKLRLALAAGDMGIWERRGASGDLALDERCRGLFGLPHDAPVTLNGLLERVHPSDRAAVRAAVLALSEPGVAAGDLAIEFGVSDPDNDAAEGRWVAMLARAPAGAKKRGGGGTPERVLGAVRDVTEQKHAAACFDALADLVPGLLWSNDPRGVTGWYNRRWFEFTGQARRTRAATAGWISSTPTTATARTAASRTRWTPAGRSNKSTASAGPPTARGTASGWRRAPCAARGAASCAGTAAPQTSARSARRRGGSGRGRRPGTAGMPPPPARNGQGPKGSKEVRW